MKHLFFLLLFFISSIAFSQEVTGIIVDQEGKPLEGVNIYLSSIEKGSISDINGKYNISVKANQFQNLQYTFIGFKAKEVKIPMLKKGQAYALNIEMKTIGISIDNVVVEDDFNRNSTFEKIDSKFANVIPTSNGGVEDLIKTLPGVSSSNELSSQYSVRGGNFDENLVYVNGVEVYRPFLIRSG